MASDNITKIEPDWMLGWGNSPKINVHLNEDITKWNWVYDVVPDPNKREQTMLISTNHAPWIRFVYITDPKGSPESNGALGGEYKLSDGFIFESRTGWSSRGGAINKLYRDYIDDEIAEVTIYVPGRGPYAGFTIYADYLHNHAKWPVHLHLVRELVGNAEPNWHISTEPDKVVKPKDARATSKL